MPPDPKPRARIRDLEALRRFRLEHLNEPCDECGLRPGVHVHHVTFRSQGGNDTPENCRWLCMTCHNVAHGL